MAALSTAPRLVAQGKGRAATKKGDENEEISLAEDLMREHGVLKRVLLIYRAIMNRIDRKRDFPPDVIISSAKLIRAFVEDYHEKLEEDYLFPRFRKANKLVDLVDVLNQQHQKGRDCGWRNSPPPTSCSVMKVRTSRWRLPREDSLRSIRRARSPDRRQTPLNAST